MSRRQVYVTILSFAFAASLAAAPAFAFTQPTFSSCLNPQVPMQLSHSDGSHGVPGDQQTYTGVDTVYADQDLLSASSVMQCLCPDNGQGIQTNWWKVSELSDGEIKTLEAQGWIYVPDGSAWGLASAPYLAQNTNFTCNGSNQQQQAPASGSNSGGSTNSNNGNSSNNSNNSSSPTQSVLGAFTELANTGNIIFLYSLIGIGIIASGLSFILRKK